MVVPIPTVAPCTAATIGFLAFTAARIKRTAGGRSFPFHGLCRKPTTSLPAVNASPAPCKSTTRTSGAASAFSNSSASASYISAVSAFFFSGRLIVMRRMAPSLWLSMWLMVWFLSARPKATARKKLLRAPVVSRWQQGIVREAAPGRGKVRALARHPHSAGVLHPTHTTGYKELRNCSSDTAEKRLGWSCHFAINLEHAAHAGLPGKLFALLQSTRL